MKIKKSVLRYYDNNIYQYNYPKQSKKTSVTRMSPVCHPGVTQMSPNVTRKNGRKSVHSSKMKRKFSRC